MLKDKIMPMAILCLSVSIIIGAAILANSIRETGYSFSDAAAKMSQGLDGIGNSIVSANDNSVVYTRNTYDLTAAATYLGIPASNLEKLVNTKDSGIPYIKIGSDYVFSKSALDKWLETARIELK